MSYTEAVKEATKLKNIMTKHGVKCSIELVVDTRGGYNVTKKRGVLSHHTASYRRQGNTPFLSMVKRGRTGVPGPLSNGYGGRDLVYRILTMGKANHAGTGGPYKFDSLVPKNNGNTYLWGTEYEGGYEKWTEAEREFMGRANAALLEYHGFGLSGHGEHKTWAPSRKIDRLGYTTASGRAEIAKWKDKLVGSKPKPPASKPPTNIFAGKNPNKYYLPGSRTIRYGDAGTDVKLAQRIVGTDDDGFFGANSVSKTKAWQKANGLATTGVVDSATWKKMIGSLKLDTIFGFNSISRLQQVMGTPVDGKFSSVSTVIKAVQKFLNSVVSDENMKKLAGRSNLAITGKWNTGTVKALQYYLYNKYSRIVLGRAPRASDYDGVLGKETALLFQYAISKAVKGSKKF